jgi:N-acetylneuraminic acid mutarotase
MGGSSDFGNVSSVEIYDPALNEWKVKAPPAHKIGEHTAKVFRNGKVIVIGGDYSQSNVQVYDPALNTWTVQANLLSARVYHTATLLSAGKVLVIGGLNHQKGFNSLNTVEIYDPTLNKWILKAPMTIARHHHAATVLNSGKVIVTGGEDAQGALSSVEIYDPALNTWSIKKPMNKVRSSHTTTLMNNGKVLVIGRDNYSDLEIYDPALNMNGQ